MIVRSLDEREQAAAEDTERLKQAWYASCWFVGEHEPAVLWDGYARGGFGIAVRSSIAKLVAAAEQFDEEVRISTVRYSNWFTQSEDTSALARVVRKRKSFEHEHEHELRLLLPSPPPLPGWRRDRSWRSEPRRAYRIGSVNWSS